MESTELKRYKDTQGRQKRIRLHAAVREQFVIAMAEKRQLYFCPDCGELYISEREQENCFHCSSVNIREITKDDQGFDVLL
jgi:predicted RNA-binding Zn-ribbon protein involved in translation (DUF1610 family)